jgi:peroxiredoxin
MKIAVRMGAALILLAIAGVMAVYMGAGGAFQPVSAAVEIGAAMPAFSLKDFNGAEHTLAQYQGKTLVLVFCSKECPYSRGVDPDLNALAAKYAGKDVVFLGVDSHKSTSLADIKAYAEETKIPYPILKDEGNRYADAVGAKVTPETFVIDKEGKLAYHGAFDNRTGPEAAPTERYVANAIDAVLAGRSAPVQQVKAWGCSIKRVT